ncbi:response regulator, partial [Gemmatimonadota bacterium]
MADTGKLVLVVDDDPDAREFLSTVLEDNGYETASAKDGVEALAFLEQQTPDLVTLDITMPEKSGVAVYRKLREDEQLLTIPVIIITGVSDDFESFISSRRQIPPPDGFIHKPLDPPHLLKVVS